MAKAFHFEPEKEEVGVITDQMQIARTTTSRAHRQFPGEMRICAGGERRRPFAPDVNPLDPYFV
jgi:hypothetical protein